MPLMDVRWSCQECGTEWLTSIPSLAESVVLGVLGSQKPMAIRCRQCASEGVITVPMDRNITLKRTRSARPQEAGPAANH